MKIIEETDKGLMMTDGDRIEEEVTEAILAVEEVAKTILVVEEVAKTILMVEEEITKMDTEDLQIRKATVDCVKMEETAIRPGKDLVV